MGSDFNPSSSSSALSLWRDFDFPFPSAISSFFPDLGFGSSLNTRLDWSETPRAHVWKVVLPGFGNEDVLVELQDERVLQVSVESGNFMTRFKIPENGKLEQLKATMNHGLLTIVVPKEEASVNNNFRVVEIEGSD